ncbi:MAG: UDP-glucose--hexose-1-phosphate uridylyltransferase [Fusobacteriaceae bacterium]|jgi:UDPglucose--hexose-1-phosphate uridylyltransferase|nr:UDP-glucose--hexose-1-phosphate uridylyltransferase [Fusobacteriaceae bacterium]
MEIYRHLQRLIAYGLQSKLIEEEDVIFVRNRLMALFRLEDWPEIPGDPGEIPEYPQGILDALCDLAVQKKLIEDSGLVRDIFDTEIMGILTPFPATVTGKYRELLRKKSVKAATEWFYGFSRKTNYIRTERIQKNLYWLTPTEYGDLEITVNLSKPEKDPRDIERERNAPRKSYPKCLLCYENVGFEGGITHPARQNHRVVPLSIDDDPKEKWYLQYSPYIYYNEHAIIFSAEHRPMKIDYAAFDRITKFVETYPHYFLGSNADLPIVGGSILTHDHYQGGNHTFPMALAPVEKPLIFRGFEDIRAGIVKWPMSVIRLRSPERKLLVTLADRILSAWRGYSDESLGILARSGDIPHNTITPIARKTGKDFELDLVLRNNRTTAEYPLGIFHPHPEVHHIKKENIGLIEVMGLAVLPGRLKEELSILEDCLVSRQWREKIRDNAAVVKHLDWVEAIIRSRGKPERKNIQELLREETGKTILKVLSFAGVFKRDKKGQEGFQNFIAFVNKNLG